MNKVRVFNEDRTKLLYQFTMDEETERDLFERILLLGLDNKKTKEDTMNRYFNLIDQIKDEPFFEDPIITPNYKSSLVRTKAFLIAELKQRLKYTKLSKKDKIVVFETIAELKEKLSSMKATKDEIRLLLISIVLCTSMLSLIKIKESMDYTSTHQNMRNTYISMTKDKILDNNIAEEVVVGRKGDLRLKKNTDFSNITDKDITPLEVFGFVSFIRSTYDDVNVQNAFIDSYIKVQTYNNGKNYYTSWQEYLELNNFENEKDFIYYCYNTRDEKNNPRIRHLSCKE